ncbi:1400_t:CDS:1, partial [Cetraspora pellucida]
FRGVYFDRVNALYGMNYDGTNFVGIFLTNGRYTEAAFAEVKNYENKLFLCNIDNLYDTLIRIIKNNNNNNSDSNDNNNLITIENTNINNYSIVYPNLTINYTGVEKQVVIIKDSIRYSPYKRINNDTNNDITD